ncbi:MAG: hypothetical protein ACFFDN_08145 [Candidatus Hodarchaeota archaeon]
MTKSSRKKDKALGRAEFVSTNEKCEECNAKMVKTGRYSYTCTECGLMQTRVKVKKRSKRKKD